MWFHSLQGKEGALLVTESVCCGRILPQQRFVEHSILPSHVPRASYHTKVAYGCCEFHIAIRKFPTTTPKLPADDVKLFACVVKVPIATLKFLLLH
jgi:hypothetical protein